MEWVPMLDHQMQCSPNSFSGFVFLQNAKLQKCKTAPRNMHLVLDWHLAGTFDLCEGAWNQDRLFHLKIVVVLLLLLWRCVKPRSALPLENSDDPPLFATCPIVFNVARLRKVINFESNASIHSNSATRLCLTKCTHLKSSAAYSRRLYLAASYKSVRFFSLLPRNRETPKQRNSLIWKYVYV